MRRRNMWLWMGVKLVRIAIELFSVLAATPSSSLTRIAARRVLNYIFAIRLNIEIHRLFENNRTRYMRRRPGAIACDGPLRAIPRGLG